MKRCGLRALEVRLQHTARCVAKLSRSRPILASETGKCAMCKPKIAEIGRDQAPDRANINKRSMVKFGGCASQVD